MTLDEPRNFMLGQIENMKFDLAPSTKDDYRRIIEAVDDDFMA